MRRSRLRWHGYVERKGDSVKACSRLVVKGKAPAGKPKNTWQNNVSADIRLLKVEPQERTRQSKMEGHRTVYLKTSSV